MLTRCNESEGKSWTSVIIVNINSSVKRFDGFLIPFSQHKFISDITFMKKDKIYSKDYHMKWKIWTSQSEITFNRDGLKQNWYKWNKQNLYWSDWYDFVKLVWGLAWSDRMYYEFWIDKINEKRQTAWIEGSRNHHIIISSYRRCWEEKLKCYHRYHFLRSSINVDQTFQMCWKLLIIKLTNSNSSS